jgi:hypothetical protein
MKSLLKSPSLMSPLNENFSHLAGYSQQAPDSNHLNNNNNNYTFNISPSFSKVENFIKMEQSVRLSPLT